jgi:hypothetical protein
MRIAYVGLSGPLFYDYGRAAERGPADLGSSPNPILDSPFGLMLLFDQIWFLTRSLCPQNMRELDYVRFLDEEEALPSLGDIDVSAAAAQINRDPTYPQRERTVGSLFTRYQRVLQSMGIDWGPAPDNHTHGLQIGDLHTAANSVTLQSILTDLEIVRRIGANVELVANSFGQRWLDMTHPSLSEADLAHVLVIDRIPNYLSPAGPYHPVVDEARHHPYLKDFRKWISTSTDLRDLAEVQEVKRSVEAAIRESERTHFKKYLDEQRRFLSVGKTLAGAVGDLIVPFAGTLGSIIQDLREARTARELRWQGFLIDLEP